jgi:predicted TIM-barrel fold metal-dependent hydrolase
MHQGVRPDGETVTDAVVAAGALGLAVVLTVRFEDVRQRHPLDTTPDLPPSAVRALARADQRVRLLVTHGGGAFVEEVHFGLTVEEASRVLWDISWLWGPPENELRKLVSTVGADRFAFGTGMPLRIPDAVPAKLDLAALSSEDRAAIESGNVGRWLRW